jgi:hypothetical protein
MMDAGDGSGGDAHDDALPDSSIELGEVAEAIDTPSDDSRVRRRAVAVLGGALALLAVAVLLPVFVFAGDPTDGSTGDDATTTSEAPAPIAVAAQPVARTYTAEEAAAITNYAVANMPADQQLQYGFYIMTPEERAQWTAWVEGLAGNEPDGWIIQTIPAGTPLPPGSIIIDGSEVGSNTGAPAPPVPFDSVWDRLAWCEASGNWATNTGNGYSGGLQFLHSTWIAYGGREFASHAYLATREQQIVIAERILADVGWRAWPACSRKLGLR